MKKIKVRAITAVLSVLIAVSSLSIATVNAAETTQNVSNTNPSASGNFFTESDLKEFSNTLNTYVSIKDHLRSFGKYSESTIDSVVTFPSNKYIIRSITSSETPTIQGLNNNDTLKTNLSGKSLEKLAEQLNFYFVAKEFLEGGIAKWEEPKFLYDPPIQYTEFPPEVINSVIKFPKNIVVYKLPDENHPNGMIHFRDCTNAPTPYNESEHKALCNTAYSTLNKCFIWVEDSSYPAQVEDYRYYHICRWELRDELAKAYKEKYGNNWFNEFEKDLYSILCA